MFSSGKVENRVQRRKPVIQGVERVMWGNSHRAARPPGGGLSVMKNLKEIIEEWELLFTGLGVFIGLPFLASFLLGRGLEDLLPGLLISTAIFVLLFVLVATGGLKKLHKVVFGRRKRPGDKI